MRGLIVCMLALIGLGGCLGYGHCGPTTFANWNDPGLYDELPGVASSHDARLRMGEVPRGLPFHDSNLQTEWPGVVLFTVYWLTKTEPPGYPNEIGVSAQDGDPRAWFYMSADTNTYTREL